MNRFSKSLVTSLSMLLGCCTQNVTLSSDAKVILDERIKNNVRFLYDNITATFPQREFALCLGGDVVNDTVYINHAELPHIKYAHSGLVMFYPCETQVHNYVGFLHSHTNVPGNCGLSDLDVYNFYKDEASLVAGLACSGINTYFFIKPVNYRAIVDSIESGLLKMYEIGDDTFDG